LAAIADGLPLVAEPYAAVAARLGVDEGEVLRRLQRLSERKVIARFGAIVRHHELGYTANAMVVWDVPDGEVADAGRCIATYPFVTLCYQRPRRLPAWPYNLFCMIHGRDRSAVLQQIGWLNEDLDLGHLPQAVLFSQRRFKQRGARYQHAPVEESAA
jgi:DNA-binding Lrp family transcriptional regulator